MMKTVALSVFIACSVMTLGAIGQTSVDDLLPAHAAELQRYLSVNKTKGFLQEHVIPQQDLKYMRQVLRAGMKPYYRVGDFNRDGVKDFAMILTRDEKLIFSSDEEAEARAEDMPLVLVVFNGKRGGGFRVAHTEDIEAPFTCFIDISQEKKPKLYFAVFESDADTFALAPAGKGYIIEFDKPR